MKCSECSRSVAPVVAVDIDGTLGDYHGHFIRFASEYLNIPEEDSYEIVDFTRFGDPSPTFLNGLPIYDGSIGFKSWAMEAWHIDERTWQDIKLAYRQGAQKRSMRAYPDATMLCRNIREVGAELWLTTTRPYLRLDNVDPDTRFWLARLGIEYDGLLYDEFKYAKLAGYVDRERVVAVLDDLPEMWSAAAEHFGWNVPILRRNPYNRGVKGDGAYDLNEAWILIKRRIETWKEMYEDARVHTDA